MAHRNSRFEKVLHASACALEFRAIALRYFNTSSANVQWHVGEQHDPEEHLIPRVIRALRAGNPVQVYGNDYPTPDGTCILGYIHVMDLAEAHVKAIEASIYKDNIILMWERDIGTPSSR